jgi:pentatricopeptide repeat protein
VSADKLDEARQLLEDMEHSEGVADVITYNTLMKGYAKGGRMDECSLLLEALKSRSIAPSQVTYGILLDGFINDNQLEKAAQVFEKMTQENIAMNTVLYTTLIKGFARAGEVDQAMRVYDQMLNERSMLPDLITFSILIKANCDVDRLGEALKLLEKMLAQGLRPDEVVFNNLLAGCARQSNAELGKRLYLDMTASGIRPSNATFSILIRLYQQSKLLEDAVEMLRTEPTKHKVNPEPRLFLQLIQSCIRDRQGRRAVEVYQMMTEHSVPQVAAHSSIISTCVKLNMYDTAAEILSLAATKGGRVDRADAESLLDGAVRKRKTQVAREIAASMDKLGFPIDHKVAS